MVCATCLERGKVLNHSEKECTWAKRPKVISCSELSLHQGSSYSSHSSSGISVAVEKCVFEKNVTKNVENKRQFRTRYMYACHHKVAHVEALLAMSKQKAVQVGVCALKRTSSVQVQAKKCVPCSSKVGVGGSKQKSYAEVVKSNKNNHSTGFEPRDCTTNFPDCDKASKNANTTVTNANLNSKAGQAVHNATVCHVACKKGNDKHRNDNDKGDIKHVNSQECKTFYINGLDDKYLHSILNVTNGKM